MLNVTAQELDAILDTLDKAIAMHDSWREQLQRTVACRLPPSDADLADDADHQCPFGRWFYSDGNAPLRSLPSFQQAGELHAAMHGRARELCAMVKGRWTVTTKEYDACMELIAKFRGELIRLRLKVFETFHRIDGLTGALSGVHLLPELAQEQEARKASGQPYSLLLMAFDLTAVNRTLGHAAGDEILRESFADIRRILDPGDRIYRYTGAEFVICLPGKDPAQAEGIKARLLSLVDGAVRSVAKQASATLEVQYGIVELGPDVFIERLINQAERATHTINL